MKENGKSFFSRLQSIEFTRKHEKETGKEIHYFYNLLDYIFYLEELRHHIVRIISFFFKGDNHHNYFISNRSNWCARKGCYSVL